MRLQLLTIFTSQGYISELFVLSQFFKSRIDIVLEVFLTFFSVVLSWECDDLGCESTYNVLNLKQDDIVLQIVQVRRLHNKRRVMTVR